MLWLCLLLTELVTWPFWAILMHCSRDSFIFILSDNNYFRFDRICAFHTKNLSVQQQSVATPQKSHPNWFIFHNNNIGRRASSNSGSNASRHFQEICSPASKNSRHKTHSSPFYFLLFHISSMECLLSLNMFFNKKKQNFIFSDVSSNSSQSSSTTAMEKKRWKMWNSRLVSYDIIVM